LDVNAEEMDYHKKLKWLKDHGELTGEEGNKHFRRRLPWQ
jgi:hypothetical protein